MKKGKNDNLVTVLIGIVYKVVSNYAMAEVNSYHIKQKHKVTLTHTNKPGFISPSLSFIIILLQGHWGRSYYRYSSDGNCESHLLHQKLQGL